MSQQYDNFVANQKQHKLDARTKKLVAQKIVDYATMGVELGCPQEQIANFLKAGVWLQRKQLEIASACRQCDADNGPKDIMAGGGRGAAKCLDINTKILTDKGFVLMSEMKVNDTVYDELGNPCKVTEISDIFHGRDCYELEFDSGEKVVTDAGHLWFTTNRAEKRAIIRRTDEFRKNRRLKRGKSPKQFLVGKNVLPIPESGSIKTTEDIFKTQRIQGVREANHRIPVCAALEFKNQTFLIHPYLMGVWLGDGSRNSGRITSNDSQILDMVAKCGHENYKMNQKFEWRVKGMTTLIRQLGLMFNKHVPKEYLFSDKSQRINLIQGLMDTDGHVDKKGRPSFTNTNKQIIDGFVFILRSLGVKAGIYQFQPKLENRKCALAYRVCFTPWFNCFNLNRKANKLELASRITTKSHYIISVKKVQSVPVKCIRVDSKSHLFLCGEKLIPTHNTHAVLAQIFCDDCQRIPGLKVLVLRKVGRSNKEQIQDFRKKLLHQLPHNYREQQSTITFDNGSMVVMGNFKDEKDIDKYLGLEYDLIHIVESNQLTLTKKMNILSCLRTNKSNWRPRCYEDTNPGGIGHFHNKQIFIEPYKAGKQTETRYIHCTVDDNEFVDSGYKEYLEKLVGWQREAWLHGSWEFMAGAYFTNFRTDIHIYPNALVNFDTKESTMWFASFDYGFAHNTGFLLFAKDRNDVIYVLDEYMENELTPTDHSDNIKALLATHHREPSDLDSIVAGHDCFHRKEEGNTIAQTYAENGLEFIPAENARVNGWQRLLDCLGNTETGDPPTLYIHKRCQNLVEQIMMAQHHEKIPGDVAKFNCNSDGVGGDDLLDALRCGVFTNVGGGMKFIVGVNMGGYKPISISF